MGFPYTNAADFDLFWHLQNSSCTCFSSHSLLPALLSRSRPLIHAALHHVFVFMPVKSFMCDTCVVREGLVCIWLLDGRCSNLYGPDASLTASPTSSQHPCEQGRLALICVAYWGLPTRCQRPQCLHHLHCPVSRWPPPLQALPAQVGHLAAQLSAVTCQGRARARALTVSLAAATGMGSSPLARGGSSGSGAANSEGSALGSPYSW